MPATPSDSQLKTQQLFESYHKVSGDTGDDEIDINTRIRRQRHREG